MNIKIISSKDHWRNGWLSNQEELNLAIKVLQKAGFIVETVEVSSIEELEKVLDNTSTDTLIWSNAYYVDAGENKVEWLNDYIQKRGLPLLGSNAQTLQNLLQKDACQTILKRADLPVPAFEVIKASQLTDVAQIITKSGIDFPMVLKPTAESGSVGVVLVKNLDEAIQGVKQILADFPHSHVIMESFLPSDDITCGFVQLGEEILLLPTYYIVKSADGKTNILSRKERLKSWDEVDKMQPCITESHILEQLKEYIPQIIQILNVQDISRIDGRLDVNNQLRFFDVNGLPALSFPESVMVKQCFSCFPDYSQQEVFEAIIHTIIHNALLRYGFEIPSVLKTHNLFTLQSRFVIKTSVDKKTAVF